jgi:protein subunit release factor A
VEISAGDLVIDTYRSAVNDHAVRITHLPTGICVASETWPTREQNHEAAMHLLREALEQ